MYPREISLAASEHAVHAMSSDDEMAALEALEAVKEKYGDLMTQAEYKRRKKALLARFSGKLLKGGGGAKRRARLSWHDVPDLVNVKGNSFKEVRAKMKGDYKSDPDCRQPGQTQALQEHPQAVQVRAASGNP